MVAEITVEYVDHCGTDLSVCDAARVSYSKKSEPVGYSGVDGKPLLPILHDKDKKLIKYLAEHNHYSPFNHTFVTFRCYAPLFVIAQLQKHEYMPWNQESRRYIDDEPEFYMPKKWRGRPKNSKQGSDGFVEIGGSVPVGRAMYACRDAYNGLLKAGVAPEMARMVLPQNMMARWIWSGTVKAIAKMVDLRSASDSQYESQLLANQISDIVRGLFPVSWDALVPRKEIIRPMDDEERQQAVYKSIQNQYI